MFGCDSNSIDRDARLLHLHDDYGFCAGDCVSVGVREIERERKKEGDREGRGDGWRRTEHRDGDGEIEEKRGREGELERERVREAWGGGA